MASVLEYTTPQGTYTGAFEYDAHADLFHGEVVNAGAVLTFQGRSIDELKAALKDTVDDYLDWCANGGESSCRSHSLATCRFGSDRSCIATLQPLRCARTRV